MKHPRVLLACSLVLLVTSAASAQPAPPQRSEWLGGGGLLIGFPQGAFADATDTGFGMAGHAVFAPKGGPFGIRLQMGLLIYGSRTAHIPVPGTGGLITSDLTTDNWLLNAGAGPQLMVRSGPVRPYAYGLAGVGYFATDTTLGQASSTSFNTTNYDDTTFAWSAGGGVLIPVSPTVQIDVGVHYVANGTVRYLAEGDLRPSPTGLPPVIVPRRTEANVVALTIGVSFGR
jgi:opacity protein-like surface antigen